MYKEYFNHAELALAAYANGLNASIETNTKLKMEASPPPKQTHSYLNTP